MTVKGKNRKCVPSSYLHILWPQLALGVAGQHDGDDVQHCVVQLVLQQLHQVFLDLLACTVGPTSVSLNITTHAEESLVLLFSSGLSLPNCEGKVM